MKPTDIRLAIAYGLQTHRFANRFVSKEVRALTWSNPQITIVLTLHFI
jgi:hypothetical protein